MGCQWSGFVQSSRQVRRLSIYCWKNTQNVSPGGISARPDSPTASNSCRFCRFRSRLTDTVGRGWIWHPAQVWTGRTGGGSPSTPPRHPPDSHPHHNRPGASCYRASACGTPQSCASSSSWNADYSRRKTSPHNRTCSTFQLLPPPPTAQARRCASYAVRWPR